MNTENKTLARQLLAVCLTIMIAIAGLPPLQPAHAAGNTQNDRLLTRSYTSGKMGTDLTYRIYLPEGYEQSDRRYPAVYLLHEEGSSSQQFADDSIDVMLDQWMAEGIMQKMIVVMPDTSADSWFINKAGEAWEDVITGELIPAIDESYRTIPQPRYRGVTGISMGGYGAFVLGLKHPELFSSIGSHMGALHREHEGLQPFALIKSKTVNELKAYRYYLDGGTDDPFTYADSSTNDIHAYFRSNGIAHEYQMRPGGHSSDYYLQYLDRSFRMHSSNFGTGHVSGSFTAVPQAIQVGQESVTVDYTVDLNRSSVTQYVYGDASSDAFSLITRLQVKDSGGEVRYSELADLGNVVTASTDSSFSGSFIVPVSALGQDTAYSLTLESQLLGSVYPLGTKPLIKVTPIGTAPEDVQIDLLGDWYFTKDTFPESSVNGTTPDLVNGDWRVVQPGLDWWADGFGGYSGLNNYYGAAWYFREFTVPSDFPDEDLTLLAGKIDDADQTYINGQLIAETGFKDGEYTSSFWAASREYRIPSGLLKRGEMNTISVRMYNQNGGGGWYAGPVGIYTKAALQKVKSLPSSVPDASVIAEVKGLAQKQLQAISEQDFKTYRDTLAADYFERGIDKLQRIDQMAELVKGYTSVESKAESDYVFELDGKYLYTANVTITGKDAAGETVTIKQGEISQYYQYVDGVLKETGDQKLFYVTEFYSESAQRHVKYRVYLPPGYLSEKTRRYPSVYLLHQFNSDSESYELDKVDQILDRGIKQGSLEDMIVVMPDSSGTSWWVNGTGEDGVKWQDMVTKDLTALIDRQYRTIDDSRFRGTSGVSMGGFGAFVIGLQYPDLFSSVASHMGALSMTNTGQNPLEIAMTYPLDALKRYSIYFDSGNLDAYRFELAVNTLHKYLMKHGVPHYAEIRDGAHDSAFYTESIDDSFARHSRHFASAGVQDGVLNGKVEIRSEGGREKLVYELNSTDALSAYAETIPASPYLKEPNPALQLPITAEVYNKSTGEKLYSFRDDAAARGAASFTGEFELPERLTEGSYEIVLTSAVLDRSFELSRAGYTVSRAGSAPNPPQGGTPATPATPVGPSNPASPASPGQLNGVTADIDDIERALTEGTPLQLQAAGGSSLDIPSGTLKQLRDAAGPDQLKALEWVVTPIPQAEQAKWLEQTDSAWKEGLVQAGAILDLRLKALLVDGSERVLEMTFTEPVRVSLPVNGNADTERAGVYHRTDGKKLEYVGGAYDAKSESVQVQLDHFSEYGVFVYNKSFADLGGTHWAHRAVEVLAAKHIVTGVSKERYDPSRRITRAEFAALLARYMGVKDNGEELPFGDVSKESWYYDPVAAAYQSGIVRGTGHEVFSPDAAITREEMAVMLYNAYLLQPGSGVAAEGRELDRFSDSALVHDWARQAVSGVLQLGLLKGTGPAALAPQDEATRAQAAQVIYNLAQLTGK
ncbi:hypothetical protein DNH61_19995 [Paenibacillus sambharensis]|uniref:SLH domain-containing protein n=1 Tax=Paenibacillus sambharensis TaxID=1803190 RepID=A0A2W1LGS6_9BACL|nr:alpha/beta hydrolase-fold protein [Paenibacillus sambharensis]PZD94225.1 hypothetical protein DNH61_19995 [Paenibacillus sambharensis]